MTANLPEASSQADGMNAALTAEPALMWPDGAEEAPTMRARSAMLGMALGAVLGIGGGALAAGGYSAGSALEGVARRLHLDGRNNRVQELESQLTALRQRSQELESVQSELQTLVSRMEHVDGAEAYAEAKRLGIIDAVARGNPSLRPSAIRRMGVALVAEARRHNLDPLLLAAIARVESGFNPFATSVAGARGLLQLTPVTGRTLSQMIGEKLSADAELYDIETNVALGAKYMAVLVKQFRSVDAALLAYNRGIGGARTVLSTPDAGRYLQGYPKAVLKERARLAQRAAARNSAESISL